MEKSNIIAKTNAALNNAEDVDEYTTIENLINSLGFKLTGNEGPDYSREIEYTDGTRFYIASDWTEIKYYLTEADASEMCIKNGNDFEYLSSDGDVCIYQTGYECSFVDSEGTERSMRLQCEQSSEDVDNCEELDQLDWSKYYIVID